MATYRIVRGMHKDNGVVYVAAGHAKPGGLGGRLVAGDLIETDKNLLALNCDAGEEPKFVLVTP